MMNIFQNFRSVGECLKKKKDDGVSQRKMHFTSYTLWGERVVVGMLNKNHLIIQIFLFEADGSWEKHQY